MATNKKNQQPPRATIAYPFPLPCDNSAFFAFSGAIVTKAILEANGNVLSVIKPTWSDVTEDTVIPTTDIDFFNGKPFHAKLAAKWNPKITLFTKDKRVPSLTIKPATTTLDWETVGDNFYIENVTVGSEVGQKNLNLVYTPRFGGFKKPQ